MTFVCDKEAVRGESYLRADYSVSCNTTKHMWYQIYAWIMIAVRMYMLYIEHQIPLPENLFSDISRLFTSFLCRDSPPGLSRHSHTAIQVYPIGIPLLYAIVLWKNRHSLNPRVQADVGRGQEGEGAKAFSSCLIKSEESLKDRLQKRRQNPDLVPSMFLWKDFGENLRYRFTHAALNSLPRPLP